MYQYNHTQLEIQNHIVDLWLNDPENDIDSCRAKYLKENLIYEGGWCDGWAYTLMFHPDELLSMWGNIDNAIDEKYELSLSDIYNAAQLARMASGYHIINNWMDADNIHIQLYNSLGYDAYYRSKSIETWRHDINTHLEIYEIKEIAKKLKEGHTLRLTSRNHDAAIYKKSAKEYIVSETELAGIQLVDINELCTILQNYREECGKRMFFSQYLIK